MMLEKQFNINDFGNLNNYIDTEEEKKELIFKAQLVYNIVKLLNDFIFYGGYQVNLKDLGIMDYTYKTDSFVTNYNDFTIHIDTFINKIIELEQLGIVKDNNSKDIFNLSNYNISINDLNRYEGKYIYLSFQVYQGSLIWSDIEIVEPEKITIYTPTK